MASKFYFRCDSSYEIGSGHQMRCMAFAEKLVEAGHSSEFICADLPGSLHALAEKKGFRVHLLPHVEQSEDGKLTRRLIAPDAKVIVDVYRFDTIWESEIFPEFKLLVIDDLANRKHSCHALLDSNYRIQYQSAYLELVPEKCRLFLGPHNCLLRREFSRARLRSFSKKNSALVFFGSTDPSNETLRFIRAIEKKRPELFFEILVSTAHCHRSDLEVLPESAHYRLTWNCPDVAALMAESKLYIGSGGTVTFERLFMGLPGIVVAVADNQIPASLALANKGYQKFLGTKEDVDYGDAIDKCEQLARDNNWLGNVSRLGKELVCEADVTEIVRTLS